MSELATVSEGEDRSDDGPDDGEDVGGDVDVGLEDGNSGVIHSIKQSCQAVPDREDRERIPEICHNYHRQRHHHHVHNINSSPDDRGYVEHDIGGENPETDNNRHLGVVRTVLSALRGPDDT